MPERPGRSTPDTETPSGVVAKAPSPPPKPSIEETFAKDADYASIHVQEVLRWLNEGGTISLGLRDELLEALRLLDPAENPRQQSPRVLLKQRPSLHPTDIQGEVSAQRLLNLLKRGCMLSPQLRKSLIDSLRHAT